MSVHTHNIWVFTVVQHTTQFVKLRMECCVMNFSGKSGCVEYLDVCNAVCMCHGGNAP